MRALIFFIALSTQVYAAQTIICSGREESYECQEFDGTLPDSYFYNPEYLEDVIHVTESDYSGDDHRSSVPDGERESVEEDPRDSYPPAPVNPYFSPWFSPTPPLFIFP